MLNEIHCGDVRTELRKWPTGFIQCVVTSPPYWGLRDYGVAGQLGLEKTPEEYVANMVDVFRDVRRVLRDDGTCWLNLGDSYAVAGGAGKQGKTGQRAGRRHTAEIASKSKIIPRGSGRWGGGNVFAPGLKAKDLVGIPWRVALALQADGWYLRADVIWAKKNCMPESVEDRPTRAHEYIFLLTKNPIYFYDAEAIKEKGDIPAGTRAAKGSSGRAQIKDVNGRAPEYWDYTGYRNKRSWWPMSTHPFPEAHFATFPPELPRTCILAGTSEAGACPACYAPWRRVVRKEGGTTGRGWNDHTANLERGKRIDATTRQGKGTDGSYRVTTVGWERTCKCERTDKRPCVVLDPFMGAGTTALAALQLDRDFIGVELNPEYVKMATRRTAAEMAQMRLFSGACKSV